MHHARIDRMAYQDSWVHRLDPRSKLCVTLLFTAVVLSLPRLAVSPVLCFALGPFALLVLADVPLGAVMKQTLRASPFVLLLGLACPYYDRSPMRVDFGPLTWETTTGWIRCGSIYAKYCVSMLALLCLGFLGLSKEISLAGSMLGALLFRSLDRAERVGLAMHARGFSGRWSSTTATRLEPADWRFIGLSLAFVGGLILLLRGTLF